MSDIIVTALVTGFVVAFAFGLAFIADLRAAGNKGFAGLSRTAAFFGALALALLWPMTAVALGINAFVCLFRKGGQP